MGTRTVDGHTFSVSSLDRMVYPRDGITKGDVLDYYERMAPRMVEHLEGRPLSMLRYPDGIDKAHFYHKSVPEYYPKWIDRATVAKEKGNQTLVVCNDAATLVYIANQNCLTPHPWLSRADAPRQPDQVIFDLDPSTDDFTVVRDAARMLAEQIEALGLIALVKTSGSRGLHVMVPIVRALDAEAVGAFADRVATSLAARDPHRFTTEFHKAKRGDRLFLDTMRNTYAQTAVAPYALRAKDGAPVATPLEWSEVDDPNLRPDSYTLKNIFERLEDRPCPWKNWRQHARPFDDAAAKA